MMDLITLGDSWVYGVGVNYKKGMSEQEYKHNAWDKETCDTKSLRNIICNKQQMNNINLSVGGSSTLDGATTINGTLSLSSNVEVVGKLNKKSLGFRGYINEEI